MAQRSVWNGMVSFGLVNVPVKLYTAVTPHKIKFNQINSATGARIKQKRFDSSTDKEVAYDQIVKGYEVAPDNYITVTDDELLKLAPEKTKRIELERFTDATELDPVMFESSYNVAPDKGGAHAYSLLMAAMQRTNKVGIGRFVLRSVERLVAIRAVNGHLTISTLVFSDELNDPRQLPEMDQTSIEVQEAERDMAERLIEAYSQELDYSSFVDEYGAAVRKLIEDKREGNAIETPESAPKPPSGDLLAALEASLASTKKAARKTKVKRG